LVVRLTATAAAASPRGRSSRVAVTATTVVAIVARPGCRTSSRTTLPGLESALASTVAVSTSSAVAVVLDRRTGLSRGTSHLGHESVELVLRSSDTSWLTAIGEAVVVAPGLSNFAVGTIASHVTSLTTDAADDAGRKVLFLRAVVLAMTDLTAVLAGLVLVVAKGTVEGSKLTKLVALKFVLALRDGSSL
jgi:hypothetical protein